MPRPSSGGPGAGSAARAPWRGSRLTAIVAALPEELAPLVERASGVVTRRVGSARVFLGRLGGSPVVLGLAGPGPARAERAVQALLGAFPIDALVGVGVAGGLSPGLETGEILAAREVREAASTLPGPDPAWLARALLPGAGARGAVLLTVGAIVPDRGRKQALFATLATTGAAAVDMESAAWARASAERGVPYAVVRSVLDRAEDDLPDVLEGCADAEGGLDRGKVVRRALRRPRALGSLFSMRRQVRRCAVGLAGFVEKLLAAEHAGPALAAPSRRDGPAVT